MQMHMRRESLDYRELAQGSGKVTGLEKRCQPPRLSMVETGNSTSVVHLSAGG